MLPLLWGMTAPTRTEMQDPNELGNCLKNTLPKRNKGIIFKKNYSGGLK